MKTMTNSISLLFTIILFSGFALNAQNVSNKKEEKTNQTVMKTYVIERVIPGAGNFTAEQLKNIAIKSCGVVDQLAPKIKWLHSYVTGNMLYCIYQAESEEVIREHGRIGGFPVDKISEVANIFSPATAEN